MITLSKSGNAVKFAFDENDHYLQNGTIEVPVNSLALIMDDSDMVTFRKSASNDIFVSANYSEFGMSKAELEAWYKTYMVGSSGGGGGTGGTTPEEVQSMIDSSLTDYYDKDDSDGRFQPKGYYATSGDIESAVSGLAESSAVTLEIAEATSGKADSSSLATVATSGSYDDLLNKPTIPSLDGYATEQWVSGFTYGKTTTDELLAEKLDASAYTPTDLSEYWTSAQTESAIEASVSGKVDTDTYTAYTAATDSILSNKADKSEIPSVSGYADSVKYNSTSKHVEFYHGGTGGTKVFEYDASPFLIDGMVQNVEIKDVTISGESVTCLVISFNTDAGKQDINIPISEIFNANNYYTKSETDSAITAATNGLAVATAVTQEISEAVSGKQDTFANEDVLSGITSTDITNWNGKSDFSGSYNDLTDKPTIPTVPTSNTAFTNDAGYITSDALSGYAESSAVTEEISAAVSGKVETSAITSAVTSASTDSEIPTAKAVYDAIPTGGTGGGKAISAGTNISVTTGTTADTINCTLPYTKLNSGTDNYEIFSTVHNNNAVNATFTTIIGGYNTVSGSSFTRTYYRNNIIGTSNTIKSTINQDFKGDNIVLGRENVLTGTNLSYSSVIGRNNSGYTSNLILAGAYNEGRNEYEATLGKYNVSNTGSTDADKTLFSVGNGVYGARHNAFEIRKNGDIYLNNGTSDVKLQEYLQIKAVKLTQAEYDSLSTYDSNTLYVIVN